MGIEKTLLGKWQIRETELWDRESLDLVADAMLTLKPKGSGQLVFIAVEAELDYRIVTREGQPGVEFSFHGFDEGDEVTGRGYAVLQGERLQGRLFFFKGDESSFVAQRQSNESPPANKSPQRTRSAHR